jgi:HEAT repeat protein
MKKYFGLAVFMIVLVSVRISTAQVKFINNHNKIENKAVANLVMALMSDNEGLRNSAINLVREYKLEEVVDALINVLNKDESESSKVMAAVTLYQIGNPRGTNAIFKSELWNENEFMKKINTNLLNNYQ